MNILALDATNSRVAFAIYSSSTRLERIIAGHFDSSAQAPVSLKDANDRELVSMSVPQGLGDEAYLAWLMQWLETRPIRIDLICHRVARVETKRRRSATVIGYMRAVYGDMPQVACSVATDALEALVHEGLKSLALPLVDTGIETPSEHQRGMPVASQVCIA
jgi:hypothetical protein